MCQIFFNIRKKLQKILRLASLQFSDLIYNKSAYLIEVLHLLVHQTDKPTIFNHFSNVNSFKQLVTKNFSKFWLKPGLFNKLLHPKFSTYYMHCLSQCVLWKVMLIFLNFCVFMFLIIAKNKKNLQKLLRGFLISKILTELGLKIPRQ